MFQVAASLIYSNERCVEEVFPNLINDLHRAQTYRLIDEAYDDTRNHKFETKEYHTRKAYQNPSFRFAFRLLYRLLGFASGQSVESLGQVWL